MEVRHDEGVAIHIGPEPCVAVRKGGGEASAGERIGQPLSLERFISRVPTLLRRRKATRTGASARAPGRPGVVEEPGMCGSSLYGNREIPRLTSRGEATWSASGRRGAVADDARTREVRLRHSSWEADEQSRATGCGAGGAKGGGQGECGPAKHVPGTEPGKRVTGAGTHTTSRKAKEEGAVHLAPPPHQRRTTPAGVLRA